PCKTVHVSYVRHAQFTCSCLISIPSPLITQPLAYRGCCVIVTFSFLTSPFSRLDTSFQQERRWKAPFLITELRGFLPLYTRLPYSLKDTMMRLQTWPYIPKMRTGRQQRESVAG